jgi:hypothetical protein
MKVMLMGGLQRVKGIWRSRRDVPPHLRPHLPPPYNMSGRGKKGHPQPVWTLILSTGTGNRNEAQVIARKHHALFDAILGEAKAKFAIYEAQKGIDWSRLAAQNDSEDDLHSRRYVDEARPQNRTG